MLGHWVPQRMRVLTMEAWQPESDSWDSGKGGRREPTRQPCPLISTHVQWHVNPHATCLHTTTIARNRN